MSEKKVVEDPRFAEFWKQYPRQSDKGHARKAFNAALKKASFPDIMIGLAQYRFSEDPKFIPLPATWLNGERWADRQPTIPRKANWREKYENIEVPFNSFHEPADWRPPHSRSNHGGFTIQGELLSDD